MRLLKFNKMKIKQITYIIGISILPILGCQKDLTTTPTNAVSESLIYGSADNIETVLNGTWSYMNDTYFTYANPGYSSILRTSDAMGNDVAIITNKYGYRDAYEFTLANNQTRLGAFWTILYKVINNTNNIITKIDASTGSDEKKAQIKGQAYALRANSYLNLVTYYQFNYKLNPQAKAVPIYTEPTGPETEGKPKSTVEQVYQLIISDLTEAEKLLKDYQRPASTKYKINIDVVNGLLARTYLNMGKWDLAMQHALEAKKNYPYMSETDYSNGFNDLKNSEWIWGHGQQPDQSTASYSFHFLDTSSPSSYYYSFMADPNFLKLFDNNDIRTKLFLWDGLPSREGYLRYQKFKFRPDQTADIVFMRASEMTLIAAESYARNSELIKAVEQLNAVRIARKADPFVLGLHTEDEVIDEILIERRKELWGEGFALSDILRTQKAVVRNPALGTDDKPLQVTVITPDGSSKVVVAKQHTTLRFSDGTAFIPNSKYYLFSVPQTELNNNPNINK
jgi:hypothetical protein